MADEVVQRLEALGHRLPTPPRPLGAYRAVVEAGEMLHVSMQGPLLDGRFAFTGLLGREVSIDDGRRAAELSVLNALAQIHEHLGRFERIRQIVRLEGHVACTEDFLQHPQVLDGASELLAAAFGQRAGHVRSVCGVRNLPGNVPVAVTLTAELFPPEF
ncbi:RidA family protein [Ensifer adhaerens]|uniref:RidA family protein n=1 Tax=Ensifer adhaerens TaxID=106592 RepID=UPI000CF04FE5|nr:RidA family protein [Ensifer adhaerens]